MCIKYQDVVAKVFKSMDGLERFISTSDSKDITDVAQATLAIKNLNRMMTIPDMAQTLYERYYDRFTNDKHVKACTHRTFVGVKLESVGIIHFDDFC